jgi:hypothetical protein
MRNTALLIAATLSVYSLTAVCAGVSEAMAEQATGATHARTRASPAATHGTAGGVPTFDIATSCRGATDLLASAPGTCLADEEAARDELAKGWMRFPAVEKARCTELSGMRGFQSYVELLTCLEMAGDPQKFPKE